MYVDGGFSYGSDVFKAIALGAKMVIHNHNDFFLYVCILKIIVFKRRPNFLKKLSQ